VTGEQRTLYSVGKRNKTKELPRDSTQMDSIRLFSPTLHVLPRHLAIFPIFFPSNFIYSLYWANQMGSELTALPSNSFAEWNSIYFEMMSYGLIRQRCNHYSLEQKLCNSRSRSRSRSRSWIYAIAAAFIHANRLVQSRFSIGPGINQWMFTCDVAIISLKMWREIDTILHRWFKTSEIDNNNNNNNSKSRS